MDRVLIVDDDVELCRLLAERLSTEGFALEAVHDPPRGLACALLEARVRAGGRILTREQLTESVLGRKLGPFDRVIDVHVSNVRRKLGPAHGGERIKSVRGSGYLFVARAEAGPARNEADH